MEVQEFDFKEATHSNRVMGLWRMTQGYRGLYLAAIVAVAIATLARTGIFYLLRYFVDDVLSRDSIMSALPWLSLGFIGLALVQGLFTYYSGRWAAFTAENISRSLRDYLYDHIQRLNFTYHDQTQTGELMQRATSDVDAIRLFYSEQAIGVGRIVMLFLVNWIGILLLDVYLGLMSVVVIPVVVLLSLFFFKKVGVAFERFQEQEAILSNRLQENLTGVRVVRAFARQQYEIDKFQAENQEKYKRGIVFAFMHGTFWPLTDILCGTQMLFGFWLGARMTINGEISVGTYLAYVGMVILIIWPIRNLGRLMTQMSTAVVARERVYEIIRQEREPLAEGSYRPVDGIKGAILFDDVSFAYDAPLEKEEGKDSGSVGAMVHHISHKREVPVLHNISFEVQPGQTVALLGATGSGKTSLVNLLPRFYEYDTGSLSLDGAELREYPREYLRQHIGIVMQEPFLFSRTIRENITYGIGREASDEEVYAAARAAAVHDVILTFPRGYSTIVGERGVTLSGGQKQRVTLARTLLKNPGILILDDATSSVDTETEAHIRGALRGLMQERTTFVIAHRIQSVMTADLILVMEHGRIVQRGTHADLMQVDGVYRRTYELQARIEDDLQHELEEADLNKHANGHRNGTLDLAKQPS